MAGSLEWLCATLPFLPCYHSVSQVLLPCHITAKQLLFVHHWIVKVCSRYQYPLPPITGTLKIRIQCLRSAMLCQQNPEIGSFMRSRHLILTTIDGNTWQNIWCLIKSTLCFKRTLWLLFPCMIETGKGGTLCEGNFKRGHKPFTRKEPSWPYPFLTPLYRRLQVNRKLWEDATSQTQHQGTCEPASVSQWVLTPVRECGDRLWVFVEHSPYDLFHLWNHLSISIPEFLHHTLCQITLESNLPSGGITRNICACLPISHTNREGFTNKRESLHR